MNLENIKNKSLKFYFIFSIFISVYLFTNILPVKAGILDNIINLFTSSSSKRAETKFSLSTNDLLKPSVLNSKDNESDDESTNFDISDDGIIRVQSGPLRISTEKEKQINDSIILYEIKDGDTLDTVASLFDISKNTIIWANNLKSKKLTPGDNLLIFPVTGISYTAKNNISLLDIAKKYNADVDEIAVYNGISSDTKLIKGESIFIPDAEAEIQVEPTKTNKNKITTNTKKQPKYKNNAVAGYFMKPVSGCVLTQGLHGPYTTAVDWGCPVGTPTVAAASGVVIRSVLEGYNGGYGGVIIISHPNGTQSIYAHMNSISVKTGQRVKQGQVIGATGNTGRSTGPHLHFETRGTRNPFS